MPVEVQVKKWGNSLGVIIPKEVAEKQQIKEDDKVFLVFVKREDASDVYGSLPRKMPGQDLKDMVREGWD